MKLQQLSPILWTKNLEATTSFYENVLGFISRSSFPNFVSLFKDEVQIMFIVPEEDSDDCKDSNNKDEFFPKPILTGSIYILTDKVDEIWNSVQSKAEVKSALADRHYLMRDFSIFDNNGYEICFGQDISVSKRDKEV
jgi:catechol 2,3-dioxygenase-like lactoylglutathione lyase family enzyme